MKTRGITTSDDYALYLQTFEDAHGEDAPEEQVKLSETDLKKAVEISKTYKEDVQDHKKASFFDIDDLYSNMKEFIYGLVGHKGAAPVIPDFAIDSETEAGRDKAGFLDGKHPAVGSSKYKPSPQPPIATPGSPNIPGLSSAMKAKAKALVKRKVLINANHEAEVVQEEVADGLHRNQDFSQIFYFAAPAGYFRVVRPSISIYCLYLLPLFAAVFLSRDYHYLTPSPPLLFFPITPLPGLI